MPKSQIFNVISPYEFSALILTNYSKHLNYKVEKVVLSFITLDSYLWVSEVSN